MMMILVVIFALVAVAILVYLPFLVVQAPLAYELYINQKILYYHAPIAWVVFTAVMVAGVASIGYLKTRKTSWDNVAAAAGDLVVVFGIIMLTTGPIWGKAAWGVWWVWDARLTSSLLLWMIFVAYALIRRYGGPGAERLAAGLAVFGAADVPLIYFAVNFWKTQHPTNQVVPALIPGMKGAFWASVLAMHLVFFLFLIARTALRAGERRLHAAHDLALDAGLLE
jgi:heme exporter protein C